MKGIVFRGFVITVYFSICFKSNREFEYIQIVVLGDQNKVRLKGVISDKRRR